MKRAQLATTILEQGQFPQEHLPLLCLLLPLAPKLGHRKGSLAEGPFALSYPQGTDKSEFSQLESGCQAIARECGLVRVQSLFTRGNYIHVTNSVGV